MPSDVDEETLPLLSQIAPVAVSPAPNADWRGDLLFTGEAVGKQAEAETLVAVSETRLEGFRTVYVAQALPMRPSPSFVAALVASISTSSTCWAKNLHAQPPVFPTRVEIDHFFLQGWTAPTGVMHRV